MNILKYVPILMRDQMTDDGLALINKLQAIFDALEEDILRVRDLKTPEKCPAEFLEILGSYVYAELLNSDTEQKKRQKILNAIDSHKKMSLWEDDIKKRIDDVTGGNAQIYNPKTSGWLLIGNEDLPSDNYLASLGIDLVNNLWGLDLGGRGDEVGLKGNIYIDLDGYYPPATIDLVILNIINVAPAYFRIILGYVVGTNFIELGRVY